MADDIKIVADYSDLQLMRRELVGVSKDAKTSASVFEREFSKVERQLARQEKEFRKNASSSQAFYNQLLRVDSSVKSASVSASVFEKQLNRVENATRRTTQAQAAATTSNNRLGVLMQQTGYQVGDFAVQVQSGTHVMVALGQQATQLVGTFGMLAKSTKLIGVFAGLGILIPIVTGVAGAFMRMRENADTALSNTSEQLKSFSEEAKQAANDVALIGSSFETLAQKIAFSEIQSLSSQISAMDAELEGMTARQIARTSSAEAKRKKEVEDRRDLLQEEYNQLVANLGIVRGQERSEERRNAYIEEMVGFFDAVNAGRRAMAAAQTTLNAETEVYIEDMATLFETSQKLREELGDAAYEALRLAGVDMTSGISKAEEAAARLAAKMGITLEAAMALRALGSTEDNKFMQMYESGQFAGAGGTGYRSPEYANLLDRMSNDSGSSGVSRVSPLETLRSQLQLETELLGKTEEYARVRQALGDTYDDVEPKVISRLEQQIVLINEAKQAEEERKNLMQTVESSLESGFMSMIDGTKSVKDAFKDMARQIIAELMRVLVVKKAVSAVTGFFGFADGGVFQGGSQVKAFADGGVVGGPTTFPMAGGQTGLMGEAGPEAIMPLKRGANGKLGVQVEGGTQGNVVVNQSFNFSANGDDSVKKLIAQAAPQIASMTQKQILDSRRRGGAMKSTFG